MKNKILITAIALVIAIGTIGTTIIVQPARATIVGTYSAGYSQGKQDAFNGAPEQCPNMGTLYCTGYHVGYNVETSALNAANPR